MSNTRGLVYVVDDDVSVREAVASDVETNCELSELAK
jgi:FixJ family two-component response regulator